MKPSEVGFEPLRVAIGKTVTEPEMIRRLSYHLQLPPQTYGKRLYKAYKAVVEDALIHGEGINLGVFIIKTQEFKTRTLHSTAFGGGQLRSRMYKYILKMTDYGREVLVKLTKEKYGS